MNREKRRGLAVLGITALVAPRFLTGGRNPASPPRSQTKVMTAFRFAAPAALGVIHEGDHTVAVTLPYGTPVTALTPEIIHTGPFVSPASGAVQNFSRPVTYTVTADDGSTQAYVVTVTTGFRASKAIIGFQLPGLAAGTIRGRDHSITLVLPYGTDRSALAPVVSHTGVSLSPASGTVRDFTHPVTYLVTAANGSTQAYVVNTEVLPSGAAWTVQSLPRSAYWTSVAWGNGLFAAVATFSDTVAISPDGVVWTEQTLPMPAYWTSVTYGNGVFVAVAISSDLAATSPDGIHWTARDLPGSGDWYSDWYSVTWGDGLFVAVAGDSDRAATSPDGVIWTARTLPACDSWRSVAWGNGLFVAVAEGGTLAATSPDGITWTAQTLTPDAEWWTCVVYGNGRFVAIADSGTAATSPDGVTWTPQTLPGSAGWIAAAYGNGQFVAVAIHGNQAATSPDGVHWTARTLPRFESWRSVTYGNGRFVAVAEENSGTAAVSP